MTKEESVEELLKNHFGNLLNKTQPTKEIDIQYSIVEPYTKTPTK